MSPGFRLAFEIFETPACIPPPPRFSISLVLRGKDSRFLVSSGYKGGESGIAEVRVLALSARNYVRELWNFMYGVSVSKYANSIRPFLRWEIVPSSCKLSPRSNGLGFSFSFSPLLDPLHASILCALRGKAPRFLLPLLLHLPAFRERNFVIEKLHRIFSLLTRDHRLPFSTLWHTNTTSIENFDGVVPPSPFPPSSQRLQRRPTSSKSRTFLPGEKKERRREERKEEREKSKLASNSSVSSLFRRNRSPSFRYLRTPAASVSRIYFIGNSGDIRSTGARRVCVHREKNGIFSIG